VRQASADAHVGLLLHALRSQIVDDLKAQLKQAADAEKISTARMASLKAEVTAARSEIAVVRLDLTRSRAAAQDLIGRLDREQQAHSVATMELAQQQKEHDLVIVQFHDDRQGVGVQTGGSSAAAAQHASARARPHAHCDCVRVRVVGSL
jgi:chromosome segregation ATPase